MVDTERLDQETAPPEPAAMPGAVDSTNGDGPGEAQAHPEPSEAEALRAELDAAVRDRQEMFEKLQRAQAEFENIRRRLQKEKEDVVRYAAENTIQSLLPIVDDFERALGAEGLPPEFKEGLELIHRRIFEVFTRAGLKEVDQHDSFDPTLHFAVDRAPAGEGQSDQQILEVYQKGYFFKDRLMRASMVKVAVAE